MKITRTSMFSGIERTLDLPITEEQLASWKAGTLIQQAMPELTADDREFIMTGVTPEEWAAEFGDGSRKLTKIPRIEKTIESRKKQ